ncbi:GNAT family N-acetyltransferase [Candidatus Clostridium radicumherbarum]|uniref:GNAT family N-acetyltransferase n=1 Tax=Candidatus Clostridium radicumherbarum TaxID=3381662 RepID=A0ABW8TTX0_9CLOT
MELCYRKIAEKEYPKVIELWNRNLGILFPMDEKLFYGNLEMDKNYNLQYILGAFNGEELAAFIIYKRQVSPLGLLPPSKNKGNVNSIVVDYKYRSQGIGGKLLSLCEAELKNEGVETLSIGRDTFHFFPGAPTEYIQSVAFFKKKGFIEENIESDLVCDISNIDLEEIVLKRGLKLNRDERFEFCFLTDKYLSSLMEFFKRTFPGRWYGDMCLYLKYDMEYRDLVLIVDKNEDKVVGFSHIFDKYSKVIGPGIYWRELLGNNFGGLGPIGIDEDYRKLGLGITLLQKCIDIQKKRGVSKMCIDWTDLLDFYEIFNFMPWKSYVLMNKKI